MDVDDDAVLMLRWQAGEENVFELLVEKYQRRVLAVAYRFLLNRAEAEDVAQEAFLKLYLARDRYQAKAKFSSFLFTIVNRLCLNVLRRRRRHPMTPLDSGPSDFEESNLRQWKDPNAVSAIQDLETQERHNLLLQAVDSLSPEERMAVILDHWENMSFEAIGAILHKSVSAVKSILFRARAKLRDKLAAYFQA